MDLKISTKSEKLSTLLPTVLIVKQFLNFNSKLLNDVIGKYLLLPNRAIEFSLHSAEATYLSKRAITRLCLLKTLHSTSVSNYAAGTSQMTKPCE